MKFLQIGFLFILLSIINLAQSNIIKDGSKYYFADRIIVKFKASPTTLNKTSENIFSKLNIYNSSKTFDKAKNESTASKELEKIYTLKFSSPYNPLYVIKEISKLEYIEWAEPHYLYEPAFDPNDPVYNDPDTLRYKHLDVIKAKEAWDINQGSEDIIIAIVDTGIDWIHPDLAANIWTNTAEIPNNGIDDDNNGFVDDYRGWDFGGLSGTPDNDPSEDRADHGTHVAGLASAVTNNGVGIASIGYNCKLMAVKTSQDNIRNGSTASIAYGYEGILYAADNGADIINCSWGNYNYSFTLNSIINYALSKGALVVAAAGNDNSSNNFYPASYDGVLSVGGTSFVDQKASWSNYGTKIDVCAPGINIYSTWPNDPFYRSTSGTSMSSPITAGLAGLVKTQFPNYSPLQIAEQIRVNTDNIDNTTPGFQYKLGSGRINAFKALANSNSKSVRITNTDFLEVGDDDGIFESGETVKINLELTNYLNSMSNLVVNLSATDNNIEIVKFGGSIGSMNSLQVLQTNSDFFEVSIKPTAAENVNVNILVSYSDADYEDYEWITILINPTYQIQTTENLLITFNSSGSIGFDDYPLNQKGNGIIYKDGSNLLFEGALIYGTSAQTIVNTARSEDSNTKDNDFTVITSITLNSPGDYSDKETYAKFNDESASPVSLGIETEVYTYSFANELDANYMFIRYIFNNTTSDTIRNFYAGQYWDFDFDDTSYDDDLVSYDFTNNFGYLHDDDGTPINTHIGFSLLSSDQIGFFAMDTAGTNDSIISWDGFSDEEKWTTLSSGLNFPSVGPSDISALISGGPFNLEPNVKFEVDFVLVAGDNLSDLTNNILKARNKYDELPTDIIEDNNILDLFELEQNYPNPFNPTTTINYSIPSILTVGEVDKSFVSLKIYNVLGEEVATLIENIQVPGRYQVEWNGNNNASGIYFYRLTYGNNVEIKKMILLK